MIVSAAVRLKIIPQDKVITIPVHRHADAYEIMKLMGFHAANIQTIEQGFYKYVSDEGYTFLDRYDAADHAYECGQLVEDAEQERITCLFSEDLW